MTWVAFVDGLTSPNIMSVDGEELPGKAPEKRWCLSLVCLCLVLVQSIYSHDTIRLTLNTFWDGWNPTALGTAWRHKPCAGVLCEGHPIWAGDINNCHPSSDVIGTGDRNNTNGRHSISKQTKQKMEIDGGVLSLWQPWLTVYLFIFISFTHDGRWEDEMEVGCTDSE